MRFLVVAVIASLATYVSSSSHHEHKKSHPHTEKELENLFTSFVKTHNKKYTHTDFFNRFNTFKVNMEKIRLHNMGNHSFTLGVNEFADLTWQEFRSTKLGFKHIDNSYLRSKNVAPIKKEEEDVDLLELEDVVDWRKKGAVTDVKNQGQCGSCWSFSATGSVEGAHFLKAASLLSLSEQQLVDCSTKEGNQGCDGGLMDYAFQYIINNNGITTEAAYPYKAVGGTCQASGLESAATITGFTDVIKGSESDLLKAARNQPVSVAIEADQPAFQLYSGGVMDSKCGSNLDHGVLVVGYGTDNGKDYWIVKNSWGASWGEEGYIRLVRGQNQCGIADSASYPLA